MTFKTLIAHLSLDCHNLHHTGLPIRCPQTYISTSRQSFLSINYQDTAWDRGIFRSGVENRRSWKAESLSSTPSRTSCGIHREFMRKSGSGSKSVGRGWEDVIGYPAVRNHTNCMDLCKIAQSHQVQLSRLSWKFHIYQPLQQHLLFRSYSQSPPTAIWRKPDINDKEQQTMEPIEMDFSITTQTWEM
jgi:hypothetical protein